MGGAKALGRGGSSLAEYFNDVDQGAVQGARDNIENAISEVGRAGAPKSCKMRGR